MWLWWRYLDTSSWALSWQELCVHEKRETYVPRYQILAPSNAMPWIISRIVIEAVENYIYTLRIDPWQDKGKPVTEKRSKDVSLWPNGLLYMLAVYFCSLWKPQLRFELEIEVLPSSWSSSLLVPYLARQRKPTASHYLTACQPLTTALKSCESQITIKRQSRISSRHNTLWDPD